MKIHWRAKFIKRRTNSAGLEISLRLTLRGQTPVDFATGVRIPPESWDADTQSARPLNRDCDEINRIIHEWRALLSEMMSRYELIEKRVPARDEARDLFNDMIGRTGKTTAGLLLASEGGGDLPLFACFDKFVQEMGRENQWTHETYIKFAAIRRHLHGFDSLLSFGGLSERKLQQYVQYLTSAGLRNSTIGKNLSFVRWFLRWAARRGYYEGKLHETFRPRLRGVSGDKEIIYLTRDELDRFRALTFTPSERALEQVRDVFLLCCFTGLRFSDAKKLRWSDVKADHLEVVTKKTADAIRIELNAHSRALLDKYRPARADKNAPVLPCISNDKTNGHLKTISRLAGIDEATRRVYFRGTERVEDVVPKWTIISTHAARRTFVVTALQLGIPAEVIMRWTGHSSYSAMRPYIAIADALKKQSMARFDEL